MSDERKLATVRKIDKILPIENADNLELAIIGGWQCVVKKGEFKDGDLCVYIEIDSIVPDTPYFEFMKSRKFRVKTIKLRGQLSQGLVVPYSKIGRGICVEGKDVTKELGITKYISSSEREVYQTPKKKVSAFVKFMCRYEWYRKMFPTKARKVWPQWISKTDEERVQNISAKLSVWNEKKIRVVLTEKLDGCSATYFVKKKWFGYEFGVCSRNIWLQKEDNSVWWDVARKFSIRNSLTTFAKNNDLKTAVIQGEIIGPHVGNGCGYNLYGCSEDMFFVFNMFMDKKPLSYFEMALYCQGNFALPTVPYVGNDIVQATAQSYIDRALGISYLADTQREGIVVRDELTNGDVVSFKAINNEFLFKHSI